MPIIWSSPKASKNLLSARKEATLAYTEFIIRKNRKIQKEWDKTVLRKFTAELLKLLPLFDASDPLIAQVHNLVDFAAHAQPERSDTKILGRFIVYYRGGVRGIREIDVTRREVLQMRSLRGVAVGGKSAASAKYNLLTGEVYQFVAKRILESLTVNGEKVKDVVPLKEEGRIRRHGKRVDDWLLITADGRKILGEVKASRELAYFDKAFSQITAMKDYGSRGIFVGFSLGGKPEEPQNIFVMPVEKADKLTEFRKSIREMHRRALNRVQF